jgi:altronate dehydratase large subunit
VDQASANVCHKVSGLVKGTLLVFPGLEEGSVFSDVVTHPNVAGGVVIAEGSDAQDMGALISDLERTGKAHGVIEIGGLGFMEAMTRATQTAVDIVQDVSTHRRELVRFSKLLPVLFHNPDDLVAEVLVGLLRRIREENGRCLWVEKGAKSQKGISPEIEMALAGEVDTGQAVGPDPGVYRYIGPASDKAILRTIMVSGAQVMAFPSGPKRFLANALIPGLRFSLGQDLSVDQICDLYLGQKEERGLTTEEASLVLFSEILATASGKLTRHEVLKDVLFA